MQIQGLGLLYNSAILLIIFVLVLLIDDRCHYSCLVV